MRQHYSIFVSVSAVALLPMLLLTHASTSMSWSFIYLLTAVCTGWSSASLTLGMAAVYRGEPLASVVALMRAGGRITGRVIVISLVRNVVQWLGLVLLIVPGLFALAYFALAVPAAAIEDLSVRKAFARGAALARGEYPRIIRIVGSAVLVYFFAIRAASTVVGMLTLSMPMAYLAGMLVQVFLQPVMIAIAVLLYYDVRERREGLDIEMALVMGSSDHSATD